MCDIKEGHKASTQAKFHEFIYNIFWDITFQIVTILGILRTFYKMPFLYGSSIKTVGHTSTQLVLHSVCTT